MQIFYINLDSRPDRREFMERQLATLGLQAERVSAVTPEDLPPESLRFCDERRDRWVAPIELSCAYSHRKVWKMIVDRDLPGAMVLEDDTVLARSLAGAASGIDAALGELDLIKIEASVVPLLIDPPEAGWLRRVFSYRYGSAGYAMSNRGAKRLVEDVTFDIPVDDLLFSPDSPMSRSLRIRQAVPAFCITLDRLEPRGQASSEGKSDLGPQASERLAALYRSRHIVGPRMLRYAQLRLRNDIRSFLIRTFGPARGAKLSTVPFDGETASPR